MGNQYLKNPQNLTNTQNYTLLQVTYQKNLPGILQGRLLLGTPRNHPEPTLRGHSNCKYGKSIPKKSKNSVKYSKLKL